MKKLPLILSAILLVAAGIVLCLLPTSNSEPQRVCIPHESSFGQVADSLSAHGCLKGGLAFRVLSAVRRYPDHIKSGSYLVQPHTGQLALFRKLNSGCQDPIRITLVKFRTCDQLCRFLSEHLEPSQEDFLNTVSSDSLKALFLPNTYEVYWNTTPEKLLQRMQKEWDAFWTSARISRAESLGLTPMEVVTLASIVEEETNSEAEKPIIAGVYLNRLRMGMPLQADPTVKYAVGDFSLRRVLNAHLATESPYNTYLHKGLPPAPICTPSLGSIQAVLQPQDHGYLYFCANPDFSGTHLFAATMKEHISNAVRFHAALDKRKVFK